MAADDEPYDPDRWLINWQPERSLLVIACDCGAEVRLAHLFNTCACGITWNRWGRRVWGESKPKP